MQGKYEKEGARDLKLNIHIKKYHYQDITIFVM